METKELKIQIPEGYEIDKENSTFECVKFKPIKKYITYEKICKELFNENRYSYYISGIRAIEKSTLGIDMLDKNNATNSKQLKKLLALNQLLNIAEYYNSLHTMIDKQYVILCYKREVPRYIIKAASSCYTFGVRALFNRAEDAQAVIDNPNFREILDTVYKFK